MAGLGAGRLRAASLRQRQAIDDPDGLPWSSKVPLPRHAEAKSEFHFSARSPRYWLLPCASQRLGPYIKV